MTSDLIFRLLCVQKSGSKTDTVQLGGAVIEWTPEKSSRKNVFQVANKQTLNQGRPVRETVFFILLFQKNKRFSH